MYLRDFVEERKINYQTVDSYIRRNPELFDKNKSIKDGKVWLNKKAISILSKKYPLAIEEENTLQQELILAQQKIIELQNILVSVQPKLLLMDQNENTIQNQIAKIKMLEEEKNQLIYEKEKEYDRFEEALERLKRELSQEKNKTWWDKLRNR